MANIEKHRFKADAASTADEARRHRELSAKGGIASGESRRRHISMRDELRALLALDDGTVAKAVTVAICREAKAGNVAAYRAILDALGETRPEIAVSVPQSPVTLVLPTQAEIDAIKVRREARNAADERRTRGADIA